MLALYEPSAALREQSIARSATELINPRTVLGCIASAKGQGAYMSAAFKSANRKLRLRVAVVR
jgi:hypothetical protein